MCYVYTKIILSVCSETGRANKREREREGWTPVSFASRVLIQLLL